MSYKIILLSLVSFFAVACDGGFERFAPPANSITGRGAKQNPKILSTTPSDGATVSPVTGSTGTQIKVIFDMTMNTGTTPVINTYVRDIASNSITWLGVSNSGVTFTWSSTSFANDTLTIQLGWVRWPEDNVIGFDFNNDTLINLDDMPLSNSTRFSFTVGWNPGRYKIVPTGQYACYFYSTTSSRWEEQGSCTWAGGAEPTVGSQNFPAGQNGFIDPMNSQFGPGLYGAGSSGFVNGRRFITSVNPQNLIVANCTGNAADSCYPYSADSVTALVWKTCSQGQLYNGNPGDKCENSGTDYTWGQAVNACADMNVADGGQGYGGRKDWRLPTMEEIEGLVDYGARNWTTGWPAEPAAGYPEGAAIHGYQPTAYPFVNEGPFPNTSIIKGYWSATGVSALLNGTVYYGDAYVVEFKKGTAGAGGGSGALLESARKTSNRKKVRCVAGPTVAPPAPSLTPSVRAVGAALATNSIAFSGYTASPGFTLNTATPGLSGVEYTLKLDIINAPADGSITAVPSNASFVFGSTVGYKTQAAQSSRYCIDVVGTPTCPGTSALTISNAAVPSSPTDNSVTLTISQPVAGTNYRVMVNDYSLAIPPCSPGCTASTPSTLALTTKTAIFRGMSPSTFNVLSAVPTNATTLNVVFSKIPKTSEATDFTRYCISTSSVNCAVPALTVTAATLNGRVATITTSAQTPGTQYYVYVNPAGAITTAGDNVVTDSVNNLVWQRCRHGVNDMPTCTDDGDASNDGLYWNDALNYCNSLNAANYAGYSSGWRAPTINELKYIATRNTVATLGYAIDTTIFPTPNPLAEDYVASTNYSMNGPISGSPPAYNQAWAFNYVFGTTSISQKDNSSLTNPATKPSKKSVRCVRSLP